MLPLGRLLKVPLMGLAEVLLIKVNTSPCAKAPRVRPINSIMAPLLMVTPLAITWCPSPVLLRPERASVGRIGIESERASDGERGLHSRSSCWSKERASPTASADRYRAGDFSFPAQGSGGHLHRSGPCG